ncbi:MAG: CsbD family protein [Alsobacter sp.]
MDKQHVKGAVDTAKGAIKDAIGGAIGNDRLQAEGKLDKAKGAAREAVGDAKDAVRDATKGR